MASFKTSVCVALPLAAFAMMPEARAQAINFVPDWTGFYLGANGGYLDVGKVNGLLLSGRAPAGFAPGLRAGGDLQFQQFVIGAFADVSRNFGSTTRTDPTNIVGGVAHLEKWGSSTSFALNARMGMVLGPSLVYATAGYNWTSMSAAATVVRNVGGGPRNVLERYNLSADGFNAGVGLEFRVFRGWTVYGEYRYVFAQKPAVALSSGTIPPLNSGSNKITLGVNHRF